MWVISIILLLLLCIYNSIKFFDDSNDVSYIRTKDGKVLQNVIRIKSRNRWQIYATTDYVNYMVKKNKVIALDNGNYLITRNNEIIEVKLK